MQIAFNFCSLANHIQKAIRFMLYTLRSKFPFATGFLVFVLIISSCSLNPNMQGKGEAYLQGEWQQDSSALSRQLVSYTNYHFKFSCDSFYIRIQNYSKVNYGADSCMNGGRWTEYTRGSYVQRHDTLYLKGQYCNPNFTLKSAGGCFRAGNYDEVFTIIKETDSLYQFASTSNVVPLNVRLVKRTICKQKPL